MATASWWFVLSEFCCYLPVFNLNLCCLYCRLQLLQDFRYFPLTPRYIQCWPSVVALKRCVGRIYTMYVLFSEVQFNIVTVIILIPDKRPEISTIVGIAVTIIESSLELKPRSLSGQLQWSLWLLRWWFIDMFPVNLLWLLSLHSVFQAITLSCGAYPGFLSMKHAQEYCYSSPPERDASPPHGYPPAVCH